MCDLVERRAAGTLIKFSPQRNCPCTGDRQAVGKNGLEYVAGLGTTRASATVLARKCLASAESAMISELHNLAAPTDTTFWVFVEQKFRPRPAALNMSRRVCPPRFQGLIGRIGAPNPKVWQQMEAEHTAVSALADQEFKYGPNLQYTTTPSAEWHIALNGCADACCKIGRSPGSASWTMQKVSMAISALREKKLWHRFCTHGRCIFGTAAFSGTLRPTRRLCVRMFGRQALAWLFCHYHPCS